MRKELAQFSVMIDEQFEISINTRSLKLWEIIVAWFM